MYANLRVERETFEGPLFAWKIELDGPQLKVFLDGNEGNGNYADPIGTRILPLSGPPIRIYADF